jgi:GT2 family glycosyltransferase
MTELITVIVPVRNEAAFIRRTVESLLHQDYPADRFEVIVIDGRSDDATAAVVRGLQEGRGNLRLLDNPRRLSSAARNLGVRHGRGELFVIVDGHCEVPDRSYLRNLADAFRRSGADCLGRPQPLNPAGATTFQQAVAVARASPLGHNPGSHIYTDREEFVHPQSTAVAYRRGVFERVGLFDEAFDACEDVEFNHRVDRAGLSCFFTPAIRLPYHPRDAWRKVFQQMARYGRGRWRLLLKHPDSLTLPSLVPPLFLLALAVTALGGLFVGRVALAFGILTGCYLAGLAGGTALLLRRERRLPVLARVPAVFAAVHFGFGWGMVAEAARSWRRLPELWRRPAAEPVRLAPGRPQFVTGGGFTNEPEYAGPRRAA